MHRSHCSCQEIGVLIRKTSGRAVGDLLDGKLMMNPVEHWGIIYGYCVFRFWDVVKGDCDVFTYGGCQGNGNNFGSREECANACKGKSDCMTRKIWFLIGALPFGLTHIAASFQKTLSAKVTYCMHIKPSKIFNFLLQLFYHAFAHLPFVASLISQSYPEIFVCTHDKTVVNVQANSNGGLTTYRKTSAKNSSMVDVVAMETISDQLMIAKLNAKTLWKVCTTFLLSLHGLKFQ